MPDKTPNAGTCPICNGVWMLTRKGLLVHHGYQRPGWGWQTDSCFGAKEEPYEKSTAVIPKYLKMVQARLDDREAFLQKLQSEPETIADQVTYLRQFEVAKQIGKDDKNYKRSLEILTSRVELEIRQLKTEIQRMTKKLEEWPGEQPLKYKEKAKKTPLVDLIEIGKSYKFYKRTVVAREKKLRHGYGFSGVKIEFEDGTTKVVAARSLKEVTE